MERAVLVGVSSLVLAASGLALASGEAGDGVGLFAANCAGCHGATGAADTAAGKALKATALNDAKWSGLDAETLKGVIRGHPKHKAVTGKVSDADFEALAAHIRHLAGGAAG